MQTVPCSSLCFSRCPAFAALSSQVGLGSRNAARHGRAPEAKGRLAGGRGRCGRAVCGQGGASRPRGCRWWLGRWQREGVRKPVPVMSSITGSPAAADMGIQRRNPFKKISSANAPPHVPAALAALSPGFTQRTPSRTSSAFLEKQKRLTSGPAVNVWGAPWSQG